jgi:lipoprotein-releasing system permease protein
MIGVLKSLGASNSSIRKIFINFALMIVGKGLLIGNVIGIVICVIQMLWKPIKLDASVYYIDFIPIKMDLLSILSVNILTIFLTAIVILGTSFLASHQRPTVCMKYE